MFLLCISIFIIINKGWLSPHMLKGHFHFFLFEQSFLITNSLLYYMSQILFLSQYVIIICIFMVFPWLQILMYSSLVMFWVIVKSFLLSLVIKQFTHAFFKYNINLFCSRMKDMDPILSLFKWVTTIFSKKVRISSHIWDVLFFIYYISTRIYIYVFVDLGTCSIGRFEPNQIVLIIELLKYILFSGRAILSYIPFFSVFSWLFIFVYFSIYIFYNRCSLLIFL